MCYDDCSPGFYCDGGATSSRQHECGPPDVFCPEGSEGPVFAGPGYFTRPFSAATTRTQKEVCPEGSYCVGDGIEVACPAGRYGNTTGLTDPACSGPCNPGRCATVFSDVGFWRAALTRTPSLCSPQLV